MQTIKQPRQERLNQLLKLKNKKMTPLGDSIPMRTSHQASKKRGPPTIELDTKVVKKPKKILKNITDWHSLETEIITWKRNESLKPKLVHTGRRKVATFLLSPFMVEKSELGKDGNLRFSNDPNKARFTINLEEGYPDEQIKDEIEKTTSKQDECLEFLDKIAKGGMEYAFYEDMWQHINKDNLNNFLNNANHSWKKNSIHLKRRLTSFSGEPNRPTFWKINESGTYEVYKIDNLPEGSIVQCEASMSFYAFDDGSMYGSSLELGENIIIIHIPKNEYKHKIPYFEF